MRGFAASALQVTASGFDLADLVNTDRGQLKLALFEQRLRDQMAAQMLASYGIAIRAAGLERLSLPEGTLGATVGRMRTERETVAAQRTAEGLRAAAEIRAAATRDGRIMVANARAEAAGIEASARREAAEIQAAPMPRTRRCIARCENSTRWAGGWRQHQDHPADRRRAVRNADPGTAEAMSATAGPVVQSLTIGFRGLMLATALLALGWTCSNVRQVPPGAQAVVLRFGEVVRVRQSGLVIALPRPLESVELLPGPERQMEFAIDGGGADGPALVDPAAAAAGQSPPATASAFLTGDGGVVVLDTTLTWRIADPAAYYLARSHVPAALRRLYLASATTLAAGGGLDDFLVARAGGG